MDYINYQTCFGSVADMDYLSTSYKFFFYICAREFIDHAIR